MRDLHIDVNNHVYVTDSDNNQVVKYIPFSSLGIIAAGGGSSRPALNQLNGLFGNFIDSNGTLYVADDQNFRVMKYLPGSLNGTIVADYGNARIMRWTPIIQLVSLDVLDLQEMLSTN